MVVRNLRGAGGRTQSRKIKNLPEEAIEEMDGGF